MGPSKSSVFHSESTYSGAGEARGLPREASLEEERQKVREQSGLPGAAV